MYKANNPRKHDATLTNFHGYRKHDRNIVKRREESRFENRVVSKS